MPDIFFNVNWKNWHLFKSFFYFFDFLAKVRHTDVMQTVPAKTSRWRINPGQPQPFGASIHAEGINFALISSRASTVTLSIFDPSNLETPLDEIVLDPYDHRTGNVWHVFVYELSPDLLYGFRIDNSDRILIDPYAKEIRTTSQWLANETYSPLSGIVGDAVFDWEGDRAPRIPLEDSIIYEMHVRGFTQHASSHVQNPGTYLGLIEKIPHFLDLGINAVELLPVHEFNECEYKKTNPLTKQVLCNYWGYSTVNFFAPMQRYATNGERGTAVREFKTMVKEMHKNGIEVILDVVFNHTAEGNQNGPVYSFKDLDPFYYMLGPKNEYLNFSGCGNTLNCNHPVVSELIKDCLRYWVTEMHVDGFRFDLASILCRGPTGEPLKNPPIIELISQDPILSDVKLISEPWDPGGLYQVGSFFELGGGRTWSEWNGKYRDSYRRYIRGAGNKGEFVTHLCGSENLYHNGSPCCSLNFVTAHDGFTLADLFSYTRKHNFGNGEDNRDGENHNESWNCGIEGPTSKHVVTALREQQMRNMHLAMMVSRGVPMLLMGDEYGHTRQGNNNAWCQDNELNWFLWDTLEQHKDFYRFYRGLIHFRHQHPILRQNRFLTAADIDWHGRELFKPNWSSADPIIAFTIKDPEEGKHIYVAFNAGSQSVEIELPSKDPASPSWRWIANTGNTAPKDFMGDEIVTVTTPECQMHPFSALMLVVNRV